MIERAFAHCGTPEPASDSFVHVFILISRVVSTILNRKVNTPKAVLQPSLHLEKLSVFLIVLYDLQPLVVLSGHYNAPIFGLALDKTERYLFTGADDLLIKIWDVETGCLL